MKEITKICLNLPSEAFVLGLGFSSIISLVLFTWLLNYEIKYGNPPSLSDFINEFVFFVGFIGVGCFLARLAHLTMNQILNS
ncbi:hypothetical protein CY0110_31665 [Crocosphaera chwakensis CCY0110]|uniref:Uncharacterized protein n=1 Tax=Crocosphaera chwakensis CCY0110 TaxID=391612 RepID=A3IWG9_9CHRO|nr:hypothetical protein CY0110_31665 [Crocosphaera chwakensis CCY0110]